MNVAARLYGILTDPRFKDDSRDRDMSDAVSELALEVSWPAVDTEMVHVLRDVSQCSHWHDVAACFFGTDCHKRELPFGTTYLIALLYDCLRIRPNLGVPEIDIDYAKNLVWSITQNLKGVGYLSDYDPETDPAVQRHSISR